MERGSPALLFKVSFRCDFFTSFLLYIASSSTQERGAPGPFSSVSAGPHTSPSNDTVTFHPSSTVIQ